MNVLHVSFSAPPDPPGGTEVYVAALGRGLEGYGVAPVVAAPGPDDRVEQVDGVTVRRFAHANQTSLEEMYGRGDHATADAFERVLDEARPDIVHQHALTPACSVELARRVKDRNLPLVFTYHTPTVSCVRGTLLRWGREVCDGDLESAPCGACLLNEHGAPEAMAHAVSAVAPVVATALGAVGARGGAWTALRLPALVGTRRDGVRALFEMADAVVALSPWVKRLLLQNGVAESRILDSPHGIAWSEPKVAARRPDSGPIRLVHLGRVDPTKGTRLLFEAMARCPGAPLELDVIGVAQGSAGEERLAELRREASVDGRIRILPPVDHDRVVDVVAAYDALVVPSQLMETGPLVVLEAFAAGVPVIGSDLGGIAEKVQHGVDGLLVRPFDDVNAWTEVLSRCARDPVVLRGQRQQVRGPRALGEVAREMYTLYERLIDSGGRPAARA